MAKIKAKDLKAGQQFIVPCAYLAKDVQTFDLGEGRECIVVSTKNAECHFWPDQEIDVLDDEG